MKRTANNYQTPKQAGYTFVQYKGDGLAIFANEDGKHELFAASKGFAGWALQFNNTQWEFMSSVNV